jgi:hypothetical protein
MKLKYKYIVQLFYIPRDREGNVYTSFAITDTRSGRCLRGMDCPDSNLRMAMFDINGGEHKQNYYFVTTALSRREFKYYTNGVGWVRDIPAAWRQTMRTRKKVKA